MCRQTQRSYAVNPEECPIPDPERVRRRTDCYQSGLSPRRTGRAPSRAEWRRMTEHYREQATALMLVEAVARSAVRRCRSVPTPACAYLALAREVYGRWRRYTGATLATELALVRSKWLLRGLDPELVGRIVPAVRDALDRLAAPPGPADESI
jgi:hypothetical protein